MNQAAVRAEISNILEETCRIHKLPLALTWVSSNSLKNNKRTLNIVDTACYVNDLGMQGFVKACTGKNLEEGQGVAGKALKLMHHYSVFNVCLLDITDYPFVNDAINFGLRAALAIKLVIKGDSRSNVDYVVEFFLPTSVEGSEEMKLMDEILGSLKKSCENSKTVRAHGYNVQPVPLFGGSNLNQMSLGRNHENSSKVPSSVRLVAVSGSSLRPFEQMSAFDNNDGGSSQARVLWTDKQLSDFVSICVTGTELGYRPGKSWGERGWKYLRAEMRNFGYDFTNAQLKNKWEWMKDQYKLWKNLIGNEISLSWDPVSKTIVASNEWWDGKIQVDKKYAKFREQGIGEELWRNYCVLFGQNVVMGQQANIPVMSTVANDCYITKQPTEEPEESSGDSEEERRKRAAATIVPDFETELDELFLTGRYSQRDGTSLDHATVTSGNGGTSNRQVKEGGFMGSVQCKKVRKKSKGNNASKVDLMQKELKSLRDSFNASVESRNSFYRSYTKQHHFPSIQETMDCVRKLDGMVICSKLWYTASKLFERDTAREMFWAQPTDEAKLGYIVAYEGKV